MQDLLQIGLPSLFLLITTIYLVRGFLKNQAASMNAFLLKEAEYRKVESERRATELSKANKEITMPLRLHAYERMTMFCARLELTNMLMRSTSLTGTTKQLSMELLFSIDDEFSHNITQQMYMTDELWQIILLAKRETVNIIKKAAKEVQEKSGESATASEFIDALSTYLSEHPQQGYMQAQAAIKKEISLLF